MKCTARRRPIRLLVAGFGVVAAASGTLAIQAPNANASISCTKWVSADQHTAYGRCTNTQLSSGTFRVYATFCTSSKCGSVQYSAYTFYGNTASVHNSVPLRRSR
jgi:uncharacterized low-complexity protein